MIETGAGLSRAVKKQQSSKKIKKNPHKPSQARAAEPVGETRSQRRRHWMDPPRARGAPGIRRVESGWGSRILGVSFFFQFCRLFFFPWSFPPFCSRKHPPTHIHPLAHPPLGVGGSSPSGKLSSDGARSDSPIGFGCVLGFALPLMQVRACVVSCGRRRSPSRTRASPSLSLSLSPPPISFHVVAAAADRPTDRPTVAAMAAGCIAVCVVCVCVCRRCESPSLFFVCLFCLKISRA